MFLEQQYILNYLMISTPHQQPIVHLLSAHSEITKTLFRFLIPRDIIQLQLTSSHLYQTLSNNEQLSNWLYYLEYLSIQNSYCIQKESFHLSPEYYNQRIETLCSNQSLDFSPIRGEMKGTQQKLMAALTSLIDKEQSLLIVQQFKRILIDPQPPRPVMRRKTVGECCRSSVQIKIATQGHTTPQQIYLGQEDESLKRALLEKAEHILQSIAKPQNMDTVLSVRYRGELCSELQVSEDSLLSLIQLIVQITRLYVCSIKAYLQVAKQTLPEVEFLQEFIYRYSMLRNSIMELDEKFQYIFQHFEFAFKQIFPSHPLHPRFNLWRLILKQWNLETKEFNSYLNTTASKIFIQVLEKEIESLIGNQTADQESYSEFNNCFHLQKFKAPLSSDLNSLFYDSYSLSAFLQQYTEYLVDISSNPLNVHWYGSSELRLGDTYLGFQSLVMEYSRVYFESIISSFSSDYVKIKLCQFFVEASRGYLKPCTAHRLQNFYKSLVTGIIDKLRLDDKCSNWYKQWEFPCFSWHQDNLKIKEMNEYRKVAQETAEQLIVFFSLEAQIPIQSVNQAVFKYRKEHQEQSQESIDQSRLNLA